MAITPIGAQVSSIDAITQSGAAAAARETGAESPFAEILKGAVNAVNTTDAQVKADQFAVATGQSDDLHTLMIDVSRADLALQTLVQLRNRALDAYNEIMKMSL
ncbi:MAG TPA: flagellar hook-basal body complex protein FliE [Terriglobales bacterium]|nr:flagellar hook-basal body complex protein FliE [Terriglobales bacterium]